MWHAKGALVHDAEVVLGMGIAPLSIWQPLLERSLVVSTFIGGLTIVEVTPCRGRKQQKYGICMQLTFHDFFQRLEVES
jgi:hypothetical protein